jgi:RimJ/RimL family protein N-acetyltransferase
MIRPEVDVPLPIESERLLIRRFEMRDVPGIVKLSSDPTVDEAAPELGATPEAAASYVDRQQALQPFQPDALFDLAITRRSDGALLGMLTLINRGATGELGYALHSDHRGEGFGTEAAAALVAFAFAELGMTRVTAETAVTNQPSRRVMERLGMQLEETRPDRDGVEAFVYGIDRDDWESEVDGDTDGDG